MTETQGEMQECKCNQLHIPL